jgi:hypothetical protein
MARVQTTQLHSSEPFEQRAIFDNLSGTGMTSENTPAAEQHDRWIVIRDMLVFQFKLVVDGMLDLVLLPVSLIVGLISIVGSRPGPRPEFYELLRMGRRTERWINLFGAAERRHGPESYGEEIPASDLDDLVSRIEIFLVDECRKRGVTAQTRQSLDAALSSLRRLGKQGDRSNPDQP